MTNLILVARADIIRIGMQINSSNGFKDTIDKANAFAGKAELICFLIVIVAVGGLLYMLLKRRL